MPCGTGAAIFGMSDAIGRSRPIAVIEDRDFRPLSKAAEQSSTRSSAGQNEASILRLGKPGDGTRSKITCWSRILPRHVWLLSLTAQVRRLKKSLKARFLALWFTRFFNTLSTMRVRFGKRTDSSPILPNSLSLSPVERSSTARCKSGF